MLKSSSSEKKLVKPLKNCFSGTNLHRKGVIVDHPQDEKKIFFGRNKKSRSSAFRKFLFYHNIVCFDWVMNLLWCFLSKKCHFQLKQLWATPYKSWGPVKHSIYENMVGGSTHYHNSRLAKKLYLEKSETLFER